MLNAPNAPTAGIPTGEIADWLKALFSKCLGLPVAELPDGEPFFSLGLTSLTHGEIVVRLSEAYPGLPSTVLFEHPNFSELAAFLSRHPSASAGMRAAGKGEP